MMLIDSHCHLSSSQFDLDREEVIRRSLENDVKHVISVGGSLKNCEKTIELAESFDSVYAVIGIHPHNAKEVDEKTYQIIKELAESQKVVGYGEIGLDFYRNRSPRNVQMIRFREQISLAKELDLPIVVHDRNAHSETYNILKKSEVEGVIHCFSGDYELASKFIDLGFYISIPTSITYDNNLRLHRVARKLRTDRILIETDAPHLTPQTHRGERNEPSFVKYAAQKVAELKGLSLEEVAEFTSKNTKSLFNF